MKKKGEKDNFLFYGMFFYALFSGYLAMVFELPIEAEYFSLVKGWKVEESGYFPFQPNIWSLNVIVADETNNLAIVKKDFEVPLILQFCPGTTGTGRAKGYILKMVEHSFQLLEVDFLTT